VPHSAASLVQLTETDVTGNAIDCGMRLPVSRLHRYRMDIHRRPFGKPGIVT
jgi:hypothetical protein